MFVTVLLFVNTSQKKFRRNSCVFYWCYIVSAMGILRMVGKFHGHHHTEARSNAIDCVSYLQNRVFWDCSSRIITQDRILPVLIVGAGPVGLVLSILLTKLGTPLSITRNWLILFSNFFWGAFSNQISISMMSKVLNCDYNESMVFIYLSETESLCLDLVCHTSNFVWKMEIAVTFICLMVLQE